MRSPLFRPCPAPMSLSDPGGFSCSRYLCDSMSLPCPNRGLLQILASSVSSTVFWIVNLLRFPTAPPSIAVHHQSPIVFHPTPTYSTSAKRRQPGCCLDLPPTSLCRSSLLPAMRACVCCHLPWRCAPPCSDLGLHPCPCHPVGVLPSEVTSLPCLCRLHVHSLPCRPSPTVQSLPLLRCLNRVLCVPLSLVHTTCLPGSNVVLFCIMVYGIFVGWHFALEQEARAPPHPGNQSPRPLSPRYLAMLLQFRLPVSLPPSVSFPPCPPDPIPIGWRHWVIALEVRHAHTCINYCRGWLAW